MGLLQVSLVVALLVAVGVSGAQKQKTSQPVQDLSPGGAKVPSPSLHQISTSWRPIQAQGGLQPPVKTSRPWDHLSVQRHQVLQTPAKRLSWHFPKVLLPTKQPPIPFDHRHPTPTTSVAVACGEKSIYVEAKRDLFGTGELINPLHITLGGCAVTGEDADAQVLMFESELQACKSVLKETEGELVYTFTLLYAPKIQSTDAPVLRTTGASVSLECRYPRLHNVSSNALLPAWLQYASTRVAEELLVFSLRLMIGDWQYERPSNQFYLGEVMDIEASVMQFNHVPLRVNVDHCVATATPGTNTVPRYPFIDNYGCLLDAKLTGSKSRFLPQTRPNKLQIQLAAFTFEQRKSSMIYITCLLKATAATNSPDAEHKACSFSRNGWHAAYGGSHICRCCDTRCSLKKERDLSSEGLHQEKEISIGPIVVVDRNQ